MDKNLLEITGYDGEGYVPLISESVESAGCADCIDRRVRRDGSFYCQGAGVA